MIDLQKQILHWRDGGVEDLEVAEQLVNNRRIRHGLFFAHLALEKLLKAFVVRETKDIPPRIHDLVRLAEIANIEVDAMQLRVLAQTNRFNIEGRYTDFLPPPPKIEQAKVYMLQIREMFQWLMKKF